ncbi:MAG: hypothetical protein CVV09_19685 [Gammaproteobacteria bacterium HGW-Gammaproteobacteria-13]|nr:MAG: hypothetical protein CVV09_19685 [Gammaproteobacteria bacterium HGW-Gammaproteobacteria-13]
MSTPFEAVADLKVGSIVEVSGSTVKVELSGDVSELTRSYAGRVYPIGQIGSVVKVHFGRRLVFGFVTLLRMKSEELVGTATPIPPDADQRLMEIQLFAEGIWNSSESRLSFTRGVSTYPLPLQNVYLLTRDEAGILYQSAEGQRPDGVDPLVPFATYVGADSAQCRANIDKMFSLHCAILGSTGSGKSGAVAAVLHSILEHSPSNDTTFKPRIIMIDPHGEYGHAFTDRALVYRAYDPIGTDETAGTPIKLPYWLMSAEEFRLLVIGKTEFEATSQHNIVYKALTHSRMVAAGLVDAAPSNYNWAAPDDGLAHDEPRPKAGIDMARIIEFDRDKPRPFSLAEFTNHIAYVQAARSAKGGGMERVTDSDFSTKGFKSILDKLSMLRRDPRIRFLMNEWTNEDNLSGLISQFVGAISSEAGDPKDLRIIDISGLPNEVAGPLTAVIARLLFQYKLYQTMEERRRDPILLVCEEAHRYVPDKGEAEYAAAQSAVRRIAREGRKYGIGLMLVSQRPADVESTVISQCGTWLVLRLTNGTDQAHVARFLPDGLSGMTKALPTLAQQEALFVGEGAALPARIRIRSLPRSKLPRSESVSFAQGWSAERITEEQINTIASRMDGSS